MKENISRYVLLMILITMPLCAPSADELNKELPANIMIIGTQKQIHRVVTWVKQISLTSIGKQTIEAIRKSNHQLVVHHSRADLYSSGITEWELSSKSFNGVGLPVKISFDTEIPESGSHIVYTNDDKELEFTALQNFFHELVHARHAMNGTINSTNIEGQAIYEENIFRKQWAQLENKQAEQRTYDITEAKQIWFGPLPAVSAD